MNKNISFIILILLFIINVFANEENNSSQPDTTIFYFAENIEYKNIPGNEQIILSKKAKLKYKNTTLTADTIKLSVKDKTVLATYSLDTLYRDVDKNKIDTILVIGKPTITENNETVEGDWMLYNLETSKGKIHNGHTVMKASDSSDDTFFNAENLYKMPDNSFRGEKARITSCDHPRGKQDWYFEADSVIVTKNNWVFAKPITLNFYDVPLGWFPFALYKNTTGRQSGIIIGKYVYSSSKGNGLKEFGFYWNMSPYTDYKVLFDYYDFAGYTITQQFRYNLRNILNKCYINSVYVNEYSGQNWKFKGKHNQTFTPTTFLDVNIDYTTSTGLIKKLGDTSNDRMQDELFSNLLFSKKWRHTGDNFKLTSSYKQKVDTAISSYIFPSGSYSFSSRKPFSNSDLPDIIKNFSINGSTNFNKSGNINEAKNIFSDRLTYEGNFAEKLSYKKFSLNSSQKYRGFKYQAKQYKSATSIDDNFLETNLSNPDTSDSDKAILTTTSASYDHRIFKFFTVKESFSLRNDLAFRYRDENNVLINGNKARQTWSSSAQVSTNIFGIFQPQIGKLQKIRHTISPVASLTYNPKFDKYFKYDSTGTKFDQFNGSYIGSTPSSENIKLLFSLKNIFEAKVGTPKKNTNKKLLGFTTTASYDFAAETNKLSDIVTTFDKSTLYNGNILSDYVKMILTIDGKITISPYTENNKYINPNFDFWNKNPFRLKSYNYGYDFSFPYSLKKIIRDDFFKQFNKDYKPDNYTPINISKSKEQFTSMDFDINGAINFSEDYGYQNGNRTYRRNFYVNINSELLPTKNWKIGYNARLNFDSNKIVTGTSISVFRDMHCWQGKFDWDLLQNGFKLLINVKSNIFKDLKIDRDTR